MPGLIGPRRFAILPPPARNSAAPNAQSSVTAGRVAVKGHRMGEFIVGCRLAPFPDRDAGERRFPLNPIIPGFGAFLFSRKNGAAAPAGVAGPPE